MPAIATIEVSHQRAGVHDDRVIHQNREMLWIGRKVLGIDDATYIGKQIVTVHATRSLADALKCLANEVGLGPTERARAGAIAMCQGSGSFTVMVFMRPWYYDCALQQYAAHTASGAPGMVTAAAEVVYSCRAK